MTPASPASRIRRFPRPSFAAVSHDTLLIKGQRTVGRDLRAGLLQRHVAIACEDERAPRSRGPFRMPRKTRSGIRRKDRTGRFGDAGLDPSWDCSNLEPLVRCAPPAVAEASRRRAAVAVRPGRSARRPHRRARARASAQIASTCRAASRPTARGASTPCSRGSPPGPTASLRMVRLTSPPNTVAPRMPDGISQSSPRGGEPGASATDRRASRAEGRSRREPASDRFELAGDGALAGPAVDERPRPAPAGARRRGRARPRRCRDQRMIEIPACATSAPQRLRGRA